MVNNVSFSNDSYAFLCSEGEPVLLSELKSEKMPNCAVVTLMLFQGAHNKKAMQVTSITGITVRAWEASKRSSSLAH